MSALFISAREPIVDQQGLCTPIWYRFFETQFGSTGMIDDRIAFQVAPTDSGDALAVALSQIADVAPVPPGAVFFAAEDVMAMATNLNGQIQALRNEINDLRQGGPVL